MKKLICTTLSALSCIAASADSATVAKKAVHMAETDPHGFTLTVVSVSVVFVSLIILYLCYHLIGKLNGRNASGKKKGKVGRVGGDEVSAAIALALSLQRSSATEAAIALAIDRYLSENAHDSESYVITIKRKNHERV